MNKIPTVETLAREGLDEPASFCRYCKIFWDGELVFCSKEDGGCGKDVEVYFYKEDVDAFKDALRRRDAQVVAELEERLEEIREKAGTEDFEDSDGHTFWELTAVVKHIRDSHSPPLSEEEIAAAGEEGLNEV